MPIIRFTDDSLRPNYPSDGDQNLSGYFSANKARSLQARGLYVPPTHGEWNNFRSYLRRYSCHINLDSASSLNESLERAISQLRTLNLLELYGIDINRFQTAIRASYDNTYGRRSNCVGTDATLFIQTAINMYVNVRINLGFMNQNWKVDFIQSVGNDQHEGQDDVFRGRCLFKLKNDTISRIINCFLNNTQDFWNEIFRLYETLARPSYRIQNPDYRNRPTVQRTRRQSVQPVPTGYTQAIRPPNVIPYTPQVARSNEPAPVGRLAQEYLSRNEVDDSIPSDQLAEMLRRMGGQLSAEIRNMIYDMLTSDFNQQ
jgi:hypothetical protein